jgi:hypothetical protein
MNFDILPYVGVGPLRFGMAPGAAHEIVGRPRATRRMQGELREVLASYDGGLTFEGPPGAQRLVVMAFGPGSDRLAYGGVKLFQVPHLEAIQRLVQEDPQVGEVQGFLVFRGLGVTLSGFHGGPKDPLAVTVFERGRWDALVPRMKPFLAAHLPPLRSLTRKGTP